VKFTVDIELGNAEMQSPEQVAIVLRDIALELDDQEAFEPGKRVRDANGNTVGHWGATTS
jgi:hypothetical protein